MPARLNSAATLARFALVEARRSGLPWLAVAALAAAIALAGFLSQLALTESLSLQVSVVAALLRAGAVFVIASHVAASTLREANDKGIELALSMPLSRSAYYLGRLAGFAALGAALAAVFSLPLLLWCAPYAVLCWGVSLAAETVLMAAAALFFSSALAQLAPALAASVGLYLLGRAIGAIQAIASGPLAADSAAQQAVRRSLDAVALLVPRLDLATRSEWLLYAAPGAGDWLRGVAPLVVYAALLAAAGLFDFHRRNL
ncbi:MAG: ABC transporter permease [Betaproteobacteria bacterium]|nr:ABC transporter permease [Betaproteobacteria bacterium]